MYGTNTDAGNPAVDGAESAVGPACEIQAQTQRNADRGAVNDVETVVGVPTRRGGIDRLLKKLR